MNKYNKKSIKDGKDLLEIALLQNEGSIIESPLTTGIFIYEAVIDTSIELNNIITLIDKNKNDIFESKNDFNIFSETLNKILRKHKIKFVFTSQSNKTNYISLASYNKNSDTIIIFYNNKIINLDTNNYKTFIQELKNLLGHELIHREQEIRNKQNQSWKKSNIKNIKNYLSDKREIMAYAWQFINTFRMSSITDENIKEILKTDSTIKLEIGGNLFKKYHELFKNDSVLKRLYKYMYQYLDV